MPKFSKSSNAKLDTCDPRLKLLFQTVVKEIDCTILEGHRSQERQIELFEAGKSKIKHSKHNKSPSLAVDVAPYPIDWDDTERFYRFAMFVRGVAFAKDIKIRWGGDWDGDYDFNDQTFMDLVHFELN